MDNYLAVDALEVLTAIAPSLAPPKLRCAFHRNEPLLSPFERIAPYLDPTYRTALQVLSSTSLAGGRDADPSVSSALFSVWQELLSRTTPTGNSSRISRLLGRTPVADRTFVAHQSELMVVEQGSSMDYLHVDLDEDTLSLCRRTKVSFDDFLTDMARDRLSRILLAQMATESRSFSSPAQAFASYLYRNRSVDVDWCGINIIDDCSCQIYTWTPRFVLADDRRGLYLFPPAQVAVTLIRQGALSSFGRPVVLNRYQHPFLPGYCCGQPICTGNARWEASLSTVNGGIESLMIGTNILLRGYKAKDLTRQGTPFCRLTDERFSELRIAPSDERLTSGAVQITNY